jgi:purine-binding chemotaxis protein CheW
MTDPGIAHNLMTLQLGQQTYALPIQPIVRIIEMVAITPVPQFDASVRGVINFHGQVVPVIDMHRHLGLPEMRLQLRTPIVLLHIQDRLLGLIVDRVMDVLPLTNDQIARSTAILPKELGNASLLYGLANTGSGTVFVIDPDHLFSSRQMRALRKAAEAPPEAEEEGTAHESGSDDQEVGV